MGPKGKGRRPRWLLLGLLVVLALAGAAGAFTRWPLWTFSKLTQAQLALAGIHVHALTLEGLPVSYLEGGTGKPVVFVHGLGGQALDWTPFLADVVRAGYHVYAMDLPGFGETAKPRERTYSVREQARFVESFLSVLRLGPVALVGISMGGWIAATVALDQPQRIAQLVMMDSAGFPFKLGFDPALFAPKTPAQVDALMALVMPSPPPMPGFVKEDVVRWVSQRGWVIERALLSMRAGDDWLDQRFSSLKAPLLLVWGKQDKVTPLAVGEAMHQAAPESVLAVFDGCGHLVMAPPCGPRVARSLIGFLGGKGAPSGSTVEVMAE
jgi:pimeloyl-ACP methyl ester carboxylesterase